MRLREGYIKDGIGYIPLTQNRWALCDAHNFHWLSQWNWYAFRHPANGRWYARRAITLSNRKQTWAPMHRVVMGVTDPKIQIDHKDRSPEGGLDNRECNLRIATGAQNASNQGVRKNNTSGCKGVAWHKATGKWMAYICVNGKQIHLGLFGTIEAAASAYNEASLKYHGEFGFINPLPQEPALIAA